MQEGKESRKQSETCSDLGILDYSGSSKKMKQETFTKLPSDIIIGILSRLPVRTIIHCKCVCKTWLSLVESREFANCHLSKSAPGLATHETLLSESYKFFEFEGELDLEHHELHYNLVTSFSLPFFAWIDSSANGLLLLRAVDDDLLYICNPITHDYIELQRPQGFVDSQVVTFGFGASKITGQHKVVGIFHERVRDKKTQELLRIPKPECQVYTLGPGSWRKIAPGAPLDYGGRTTVAFLNGSLHWLASDLNGHPWISCFDLGTELFSTFSSPPLPGTRGFLAGLFALGGGLWLCDNTSDDEIVIWLMKEYGVENSWTKEYVIRKIPDFSDGSYSVFYYPIKVFKDGDILMAWEDSFLFYYANKTGTTQKIEMSEMNSEGGSISGVLHTPSFFSLKSFGIKNVRPII